MGQYLPVYRPSGRVSALSSRIKFGHKKRREWDPNTPLGGSEGWTDGQMDKALPGQSNCHS